MEEVVLDQNPIYVYQNSGIFTVTLNVLDDKGCENIYIRNDLIESKEVPQSNFSSNIFTTCDSVKEIIFFNNSLNGTIFTGILEMVIHLIKYLL